MEKQKLYIIHGAGNDSIGLVEKITSSIAGVRGNIVDMRQDVMHGLFTVFVVVDLQNALIGVDEFKNLVNKIADNTNLILIFDKYIPVPRNPDISTILLVLLGHDMPGIIAAISKNLSDYAINIESSQMVAREGVFLMELMVDISRCTLPVENLKNLLKEEMAKLNIHTMFQFADVFNNKKRIIVFDILSSFITRKDMAEIIQLSHINGEKFYGSYPPGDIRKSLTHAASLIENLPVDVIHDIVSTIEVSTQTMELVQTLKRMGYRIAVITSAFSFFTEHLKQKLNIDYAFGCGIEINDDIKTIGDELDMEFFAPGRKEKIISRLITDEFVEEEDVTIIQSDLRVGEFETPGIAIKFSIKTILDHLNQHIISKDNLSGLLGSFGIPVK